MNSQPTSTPVEASANMLPCYMDPFRDCSEKIDSITKDIMMLAAALFGVGLGIIYLYLLLFA